MPRFWLTLVANLPMLLMLLPIVGALLVLGSAHLGREAVRRTALTNVILSTLLVLILIGAYNTEPVGSDGRPLPFQMVSVLPWLQDGTGDATVPHVMLAVGLDGLSVWPVVLTVLIMLPVLRMAEAVDSERPASLYAAILLLESATLGLFLALDAILMLIALFLVILLQGYLLGGWGGHGRRRAVALELSVRLCGAAFTLLGLMALIVASSWVDQVAGAAETPAAPTFLLPRLLGIRTAAVQSLATATYWMTTAGWIGTALGLGIALLAPIVPFHSWFLASVTNAPPPARIFAVQTVPVVATYLTGRLVVPVFPEFLAGVAGSLLFVLLAGALVASLLSLACDEPRRKVAAVVVSLASIALAGMVTLEPGGVAGGVLLSLAVSTSAALALFGFALQEEQAGPVRFESQTAAAVLSLACVPGLAAFPGLWMTLVALHASSGKGLAPPFTAAAVVVVCSASLATLLKRREAKGPAAGWKSEGESATSTAVRDALGVVPLWIVLVVMGLAPGLVVARLAPAVLTMLPR